MKIQHKFTTYLKHFRKQWGFTQKDMAYLCELTQPFYSLIENHKVINPEFDTFRKLAKGMRVDYKELIVLYLGL